jgi:hypothetical protein
MEEGVKCFGKKKEGLEDQYNPPTGVGRRHSCIMWGAQVSQGEI